MSECATESQSESAREPSWSDVRQRVLGYAEMCAAAAVTLALRPHGTHAAAMARQLTEAVRDLGAQLRFPVFSETVIEAERSRAAEEALRAAGVSVPAPRGSHLHLV